MEQNGNIINGFFSMLPEMEGMVELNGGLALYGSLHHPDNIGDLKELRSKNVNGPIRTRFMLAYFCKSGTTTVRMNLKDYPVSPGTIIIAMPGTIIENIDCWYSAKGAAIIISEDMYHLLPNEYIETVKGMELAPPFIFTPSITQLDIISDAIDLLYKLIQQPSEGHRDTAIQGCLQILSNILIDSPRRTDGENKDSKAQLIHAHFLKDVGKHYRTHREIQYYASLQCLSPKYFGQIILTVSGRYPADIIREYVIVEAKVMLKSHHYTIQMVSDYFHFSNQSAFGKYFKKATGLSPRAFVEENNRES